MDVIPQHGKPLHVTNPQECRPYSHAPALGHASRVRVRLVWTLCGIYAPGIAFGPSSSYTGTVRDVMRVCCDVQELYVVSQLADRQLSDVTLTM